MTTVNIIWEYAVILILFGGFTYIKQYIPELNLIQRLKYIVAAMSTGVFEIMNVTNLSTRASATS